MEQVVQDTQYLVQIAVEDALLEGTLTLPRQARSVVLFAHGSGSSRHSPRNIFVAGELNRAGLGTLLIDLLTRREDEDYATRFDIELLAERLVLITDWLRNDTKTSGLKIGYFGASTGAAAALKAAVARAGAVGAVVSRGGRPDLAGEALPRVTSPTLLMVGGIDYGVIELNEAAYDQLTCPKQMVIVPGASHLFEEPGTLEQVATLAAEWFTKKLRNE